MKKFLSFVLIAALALPAFAGCAQKVSGTISTDGSTAMEDAVLYGP